MHGAAHGICAASFAGIRGSGGSGLQISAAATPSDHAAVGTAPHTVLGWGYGWGWDWCMIFQSDLRAWSVLRAFQMLPCRAVWMKKGKTNCETFSMQEQAILFGTDAFGADSGSHATDNAICF